MTYNNSFFLSLSLSLNLANHTTHSLRKHTLHITTCRTIRTYHIAVVIHFQLAREKLQKGHPRRARTKET
jgi:hypothetical protein